MKKQLFRLLLPLLFFSCTKNENSNDVTYRNIGLTVPLNTGFVYRFDFGNFYTTDVEFWFKQVGTTFTAYYKEDFGGAGFRCTGVNNYTEKVGVNSDINPAPVNPQATKFIEVTQNGANLVYTNSNGLRFDDEVYLPIFSNKNGVNATPIAGWLRIKCTQTNLYIYDFAYKNSGSIKAGEK